MKETRGHFQQFLWRLFVTGGWTISIHDRGKQNRRFKTDHDADRVGFVPISKQGISTALKQESKSANSNKTDASFSTRFSFNLYVALQKRAWMKMYRTI